MSAQERQRQEVIFEIIDTEKQYVADMKLLVEKLLHPAIEKNVLSREDAGHLCLNVETLLDVNSKLLADFEALQAASLIIPGIGPTLLTRCDHFKLYAVYVFLPVVFFFSFLFVLSTPGTVLIINKPTMRIFALVTASLPRSSMTS